MFETASSFLEAHGRWVLVDIWRILLTCCQMMQMKFPPLPLSQILWEVPAATGVALMNNNGGEYISSGKEQRTALVYRLSDRLIAFVAFVESWWLSGDEICFFARDKKQETRLILKHSWLKLNCVSVMHESSYIQHFLNSRGQIFFFLNKNCNHILHATCY